MRETQPLKEPRSALVRSFAACLAALLETDVASVPHPAAGDPFVPWGGWLAARGLGLVPVLRPRSFSRGGYWVGVVQAPEREPAAALMFGAPPGVVWLPLGGRARLEDLERGYVVAALDPALWQPTDAPPGADRRQGLVEAIAVCERAEGEMHLVPTARALAGRGLEGDRYARGAGTFSNPDGEGHDLTLIEAEALDGGAPAPGLAYERARRNVVTRGIDLDALVGHRFSVGEAECVGRRLCEPCAHLERLTVPGVLRALVHRGGLRADVLRGGVLSVGAEIRPVEP